MVIGLNFFKGQPLGRRLFVLYHSHAEGLSRNWSKDQFGLCCPLKLALSLAQTTVAQLDQHKAFHGCTWTRPGSDSCKAAILSVIEGISLRSRYSCGVLSCACLSAALGNGLRLCPNPVQDYLMLPLHGFLPVEKMGVQASMRTACRQITERNLK